MKQPAHTDSQSLELVQPTAPVAVVDRRPPTRGPTKLRTVTTFLRRGACSNTLMTTLDRHYGHPMDREERATDPLAGGLMMGYQCGMLWGSTLAAGAEAHRRQGATADAEGAAMRAAQGIVEGFRGCHGHLNCLEITETDPRRGWQVFVRFFLKGETFRCMGRAARYAPVAFEKIEDALTRDPENPPRCQPASCAATLARRMGATEQQAIMAAGLAGGIGLSGGACGALGAAIWLIGLQGSEQGLTKKEIKACIEETVERFQRATDFELECAEIVGRRFADIDDHSRHVQAGGCHALLEVLAGQAEEPAALPPPVATAA